MNSSLPEVHVGDTWKDCDGQMWAVTMVTPDRVKLTAVPDLVGIYRSVKRSHFHENFVLVDSPFARAEKESNS